MALSQAATTQDALSDRPAPLHASEVRLPYPVTVFPRHGQPALPFLTVAPDSSSLHLVLSPLNPRSLRVRTPDKSPSALNGHQLGEAGPHRDPEAFSGHQR